MAPAAAATIYAHMTDFGVKPEEYDRIITGDLGTVAENAGIAFDKIMKIVDEAIPQIADQIVKHLPQLIETGMKLLSAVAQGVAENMPMLMDTAWTILETLGTTLNDNLDTILDKGIEIVLKIIEGISNKLPDLIPVAIEIITKIATSLLEHLPEILAMGINLIQKLALGIIQAIPDLLASMFKIVNTIRNTIPWISPWDCVSLLNEVKDLFNDINILKCAMKEAKQIILSDDNKSKELVKALEKSIESSNNFLCFN